MIVDSLKNASLYQDISPLLRLGFDYLRTFDPETRDGRIRIAGDDLYVLVQSFWPDPPEKRRFEAHRDYLDVQWVFQGSETIYIEQKERLTPETSYDSDRDIHFFRNPKSFSGIVLQPGDFALLFPQDAHKPCCMAHEPDMVRKAVLKIRIAACWPENEGILKSHQSYGKKRKPIAA